MAFRNPPIAGLTLVRPALQSPNYVLGSAGWTINRDGTVEFNNGTFRGSLEIGNLAAQHAILANTATGDVVDVYDSSNSRVMYIDATGTVNTVVQPSGDVLEMQGNALTFFNQSSTPNSRAAINGVSNASGSHLILDSGRGAASNDAILWLLDAISSSDGKSYVRAEQKASSGHGPIVGSVVQTDTDSSANNCLHMGSYSGTTDVNGFLFPTHGAGFTPTGGVMVGTTAGGTFANLTYGLNGFSATIMSVNFKIANTGAAYANQAISFNMLMWA